MKYATVEEKSSPESTNVPIKNGRTARLTLYTRLDFSVFFRMYSYPETIRLAIRVLCVFQMPPVLWTKSTRQGMFVALRLDHDLHSISTCEIELLVAVAVAI